MEDLIRRSDAIKGAKRLHNLFSSPFYNRDRVEMIEAYFNDIPSADRPQGEWICHEGGWKDFDYYPTKYECDQCHHYVDVASDKKFCPNCGARMFAKDTNVPNKKGADDD